MHVCGPEPVEDLILLKTSVGDIKGHSVLVHLDDDEPPVTVDQYLGIPFAAPPVGQLRFADPVPLDRLPSGKRTLFLYRPTVHFDYTFRYVEYSFLFPVV